MSCRWPKPGTPAHPPGARRGAAPTANDLSDPGHLVAVTARSNRSKADQDPGTWLPIEPVRCRYIAEWTAIKTRWELTADTAEKDALTAIAAGCPNVPVDIVPLP